MPIRRRLFVLGLVFAAAGVAGEQGELVELASRFSIDEVKFVQESGTSTVSGTAFLKLADGTFKNCAGFKVELLPVAAYSSERIVKTYGNDRQGQILMEQNPPMFTPDAPEYHDLLIKGACDQRGEFSFSDVPAGDYFVIALIIWDAAASPAARKTGGGVMKRIQVSPGSRVEVLLRN